MAQRDDPELDHLHTEIAVLEEENSRLREEYTRARQVTYRRTALGLFGLGVLGLAGGVVFPDVRTVLVALGGTGIFAGFLTYVLTPERFVSTRVGGRVFQALLADRNATIDELGLEGEPVYVPADDTRLFVPRYETEQLPNERYLTDLFVVPDDPTHGGVAFHPTGAALFEEFEAANDRSLSTDPDHVAPLISDAVVELFELADGIDHDVDRETNRITYEVVGTGFGDPTALDHPVGSFLAVSLARALDTPVRVDVSDDDPLVITCRYR